ncbi:MULTISPECIES: alpha/beta fold hydrolase [unclassified Nocardioides]|uniref:alpha/beta fold hydrolase n=1 Tax=unclassified Nocardioides TaxID=2615069 RepID=UPI00005712E2|nr:MULTISPECIES: alpha/beta fold hydrolase [unclassified Nocardioides]ABL80572.1 alpha/beta hydrolase fold protein [Nocardioides sp. JS614]
MRTHEQQALNAVQRPEAYREVLLDSAGFPVALSVWKGEPDAPAVVFLPGTMTHPLFYEDFLDALNRAGFGVVGVHPAAHGKSPRVRRRPAFADLVTNASDALAWTVRTMGAPHTVLIGSSQGGILALAVAAETDLADHVFAHNALDPALPGSLDVTRAPRALRPAYPAARRLLALAGRLAPGVPVPIGAYLELARVSGDPAVVERFFADPLGRRSYPLGLLAGLLATPLRPARCPVTVVAGTRDRLFPLAYMRAVYERIEAPAKDLLLVESDQHLLFNEDLDAVLPLLLPRLLAATAAS